MLIYRAVDELVSLECFDLDVETVAAQEDVGRDECNPLIAVDEAVIAFAFGKEADSHPSRKKRG